MESILFWEILQIAEGDLSQKDLRTKNRIKKYDSEKREKIALRLRNLRLRKKLNRIKAGK